MSRFADVVVIAKDAEEVMAPLTREDPDREWRQRFTAVSHGFFSHNMWITQFERVTWRGLLPYLESLPWPDPYSVQVLIRDEEDECFGLWMKSTTAS
jgi:hypothetical protein